VVVVTLKSFRYIALIEATSFLALLVATVVKHSDGGATGVQILGPIHGALFLAYVINVFAIRTGERWSAKVTCWILLGAVLPFGGYVVDWWLARERRIAA
jgi:integral membrane protein